MLPARARMTPRIFIRIPLRSMPFRARPAHGEAYVFACLVVAAHFAETLAPQLRQRGFTDLTKYLPAGHVLLAGDDAAIRQHGHARGQPAARAPAPGRHVGDGDVRDLP